MPRKSVHVAIGHRLGCESFVLGVYESAEDIQIAIDKFNKGAKHSYVDFEVEEIYITKEGEA